MNKTTVQVFLIINLFIYSPALSQQFGSRVGLGIIESDEIIEASGIEASSKNPGVFWTFNDSGGENKIYAFSTSGKELGTYIIEGAINIDWEDITIDPGLTENEHYLYIGDFGDNGKSRYFKYIYRIPEPSVDSSQAPIDTIIEDVRRLIYRYPEGIKYNAESLMIDPLNKDIYIVLKEYDSRVYKVKRPYSFHQNTEVIIDTLEVVSSLFLQSKANAADISSNGREVLIKDDDVVYYWNRNDDESIAEILTKDPIILPYIQEPNGEGICWNSDASGYYTLSEGLHPQLYFYPRISTNISNNENYLSEYKLNQNYPNPFNSFTTINYYLPEHTIVELDIFDISGQLTTTLVNKKQVAGTYSVQWNGRNEKGLEVSSGFYFYRLKTSSLTTTRMMILQ